VDTQALCFLFTQKARSDERAPGTLRDYATFRGTGFIVALRPFAFSPM
jgi:hypothetical protein